MKRNLMVQAHKIAKSIVAIVGDYMVAMKIALKQAWERANMKTLRVIDHKLGKIVVTMDSQGGVFLNGEKRNVCKDSSGLVFVWSNSIFGIKNAKIALEQKHIDMIDSATLEKRQQAAEYAKKAREWNNANNEGGEGYNPYFN